MEQVLNVFVNGTAGVFVGITVLYLAIRLNALICGRFLDKSK
jgi:hypothetical protein